MHTRLFTDSAAFAEGEGHGESEGQHLVRELMEGVRRRGPDGVRLSFGVEGQDGQLCCLVETENMVEAVDILTAARELGMSIAPGRKERGVWLHRILRRGAEPRPAPQHAGGSGI
jgi:hypothetical protein